MSRDKSPQARIALAEELWQLARTGPSEIAELMHTNDLAVEILRAGLDLYVQQTQSEEHSRQTPDELMQLKKEHEHIVQLLHNATLALKVTEDDLQRKIDFDPEYDETGSEQADRFERGIGVAIARLEALRDAFTQRHLLDLNQFLWNSGTGE
jgi:hypothetical protein